MALARREWLQHRFSWALMAGVPTVLVLLLLSFGTVQVSPEERDMPLPLVMTLASLGGGMGLHLVMLWVVALIFTAGFAGRDHADRSVEFWLSLPAGHGASLGLPLAVHLLLLPVAAIGVGLLGGLLASLVLVSRAEGFGAWLALPWGALLTGALATALRLAVGNVLAVAWLAPLLLLTVLFTAWFRRGGLVVLALGLGVAPQVLEHGFGIAWPARVLGALLANAGRAVANAGAQDMAIESPADMAMALDLIPRWAAADAGQALANLVSPLFLGGLVVAAACFGLLMRWRQLGAEGLR